MNEILRLRARIDEIDQEITFLIKSRHENARQLGRIKEARGISLRDPKRERIILRKVSRFSAQLRLDPKMTEDIFQKIFKLSVKAQESIREERQSNLDGIRMLIVGGTGRMGRFLATLVSLHGARVKIAGRSISKTQKIAKEIEVESGTILDAAASDIVMVSVPVEETVRVAVETASLMKEGSLLSDVSSVKTGISDQISERISPKIEYVSIHPLFGPDIDHLYRQSVAAILYRNGPRWAKLYHALRESGARIYEMTATQHDRRMAYVQGLHHFAMMALGIALGDKGREPLTRSLRDTETRISTMIENWETVRAVQMVNSFVPKVRQDFVETSERLSRMRVLEATRVKLVSNVQKWSRKQ